MRWPYRRQSGFGSSNRDSPPHAASRFEEGGVPAPVFVVSILLGSARSTMMAVTVCFSHVGCNVRFSDRTGFSSRVAVEDEELNEHRLLREVPQGLQRA